MFLGFNAFCGDAPILSVNGAVKGLTIEHNATGISEQNVLYSLSLHHNDNTAWIKE